MGSVNSGVWQQGNRVNAFFVALLCFVILGGISLLIIEKGDVLLLLSRHRLDFWDVFFKYFTLLGEAWAYLLVIIIFLFVEYRQVLFIPLLGGLVSGLAYLLKNYFHHPRPLLFFTRLGIMDSIPLVPGVILHGGNSSFPSGHTLSAFALYAFLSFTVRSVWLQLFLFVVAFVVGFSRIYLAQHFLEDVYLGAIIGSLLGLVVYWLGNWALNKTRKG